MIYNGVNLLSAHPRLSIEKEIPPGGAAWSVTSLPSVGGERFAGVSMGQDEYRVNVNVACRNKQDAWQARTAIAAWACSSNEPAPLIPTHWPQVHYMAVCKEISPPEFVFGFGVITVSFALLRPVAMENHATVASGSGSVGLSITGSEAARPIIRQTLGAAASSVALSLDGVQFFRLAPATAYKRATVLEIDFLNRTATVNGVHAETDIDYPASRWVPGFKPGYHTITSTDAGELRAEWRNEWK